MAAAVHRLHAADSAISAEERARILAEAKANIANKQNPTAPVAPHRMEDAVQKWRREGIEAAEREAAERARRKSEETADGRRLDDWIAGEVARQNYDLVKALGAVCDAVERGANCRRKTKSCAIG